MTFQDLNLSNLQLRALDDAGLTTPTPIQEKAFPVIMSGRDVVGIAQTGTGKTIAYLLPVLRLWKFSKERFPQVLIIVPTRELVVQVVEEIERLTTYQNVVTVGVYGGANINKQKDAVDAGLDILVGTPGRTLDLALHGTLNFKAIKRVIIDEMDELLELGFRPQLQRIFDQLPDKRQNLLFSATLIPEIGQFIEESFDFPDTIEAAPSGTPLEKIEQVAYSLPNFNTKVNLLKRLLADKETFHRVLVFAPGKRLADVVAETLEGIFPGKVAVIHGNKSQNYRFESLRAFQSGEKRMLIATDLVSRGLDLSDVSHVINLDVPEVAENYVHRIGRTGRADKSGVAITLYAPYEEEKLSNAEELMQTKLVVRPNPEDLEISDQLILEEMPDNKVANIRVKLDTTKAGAYHNKSKRNSKVNLTRRELEEKRGRKRGKRKSNKKWKK
ncbi:DEAD/DEAH box helicase [Lewinellaceae bacterium SD302]|nr:DEAD/DEAH box helicase [Lewinellaceae bacterium SD302]